MMLNKVHAISSIRALEGDFFSPTLSEGRRKSVSLGPTAYAAKGGLN